MIAGVKSEVRKLLSVRSTYILVGLALIYLIFYDFYIVGFEKGMHHGGAISPLNPHFLMGEVTRAGGIVAPVLFSALVAVLLMAHEYRHNTIMYTLTASNSRSKTLLAKIIAISVFAVIFSLLLEVLAPSLALLGLHFHHATVAHQQFYYFQFFWRTTFYSWAYAMIGIVLAIFLRNIVASVAAIFLLPVTVEPLIGLLLSTNQQQYLPFTALSSVINNGFFSKVTPGLLSAERSAIVAVGYIVVAWAVAWVIFLRRDAS